MKATMGPRTLGKLYGEAFAQDWIENPAWFPKGKESVPSMARRIASTTLDPYTEKQRIVCGQAAFDACTLVLFKKNSGT